LIVCVFFIFVAMIEYGIVLVIVEVRVDLMEMRNKVMEKKSNVIQPSPINNGNVRNISSNETKAITKKIDSICLIAFPSSFVVFNVIYWMIYW
jgi:hypothetical protein